MLHLTNKPLCSVCAPQEHQSLETACPTPSSLQGYESSQQLVVGRGGRGREREREREGETERDRKRERGGGGEDVINMYIRMVFIDEVTVWR